MYKDNFASGGRDLGFVTLERELPVRRQNGVDSEYGLLQTVLLADPRGLAIVPCNSVSRQALREGRECHRPRALRQHGQLRSALEAAGVAVEFVEADPDLPDASFTRDSSLMTPWGLLGLRPGASHRTREVERVIQTVQEAGLKLLGQVKHGCIEGGDIAILRPGLVAIGISGVRTDDDGAEAVAALFRSHGWTVINYHFDPHFLHLDTLFCMVDRNLALACVDVLDDDFVAYVRGLGIELVEVSYKDARKLGCNLLSLGENRVISSGTSPQADRALSARGYQVIEVELDEFIQCGGGVHCLTMPLARAPG